MQKFDGEGVSLYWYLNINSATTPRIYNIVKSKRLTLCSLEQWSMFVTILGSRQNIHVEYSDEYSGNTLTMRECCLAVESVSCLYKLRKLTTLLINFYPTMST